MTLMYIEVDLVESSANLGTVKMWSQSMAMPPRTLSVELWKDGAMSGKCFSSESSYPLASSTRVDEQIGRIGDTSRTAFWTVFSCQPGRADAVRVYFPSSEIEAIQGITEIEAYGDSNVLIRGTKRSLIR